jgi:hypothetical protein
MFIINLLIYNIMKVYMVGDGELTDVISIRKNFNIPDDVELIFVKDDKNIPLGMKALNEYFILKNIYTADSPFIEKKYKSWERPYKYHK